MTAAIASDATTTLHGWLHAGRTAYPDVRCPDVAMVEHLRSHAQRSDDVQFGAELFLAAAALAGDPAAIRRVERLLQEAAAAARRALSPSELDEELQLLRTRLLVSTGESAPKLGTYGGRAPLGAWLRIALLRRGLSVRRRAHSGLVVDVSEEAWLSLPAITVDPAIALLRRELAPVFKKAFKLAFAQLDPQAALLLRQHLLDGASALTLAKLHHTHRSTVHRWITDAKECLLELLRAELRCRIGLDGERLASLVQAIRTDLARSLASIVGE